MDVIKQKTQKKWKNPYVIGLAAIGALGLLTSLSLSSGVKHSVDANSLLLGTVKRGNLEVIIDGYGVLRSNKQTLITSQTAATVEEVVLRPGAAVEPDSIILKLSNPELVQQLDAARVALTQEQAQLRRLKLDNERELLAEQAKFAELDANFHAMQLRSEAEAGLAGGAVSQLAYKTTVLQRDQLNAQKKLELQRLEQLHRVMKEAVIIQTEQINQASAFLRTVQERADRLTVKAGIKGILQRLPVELGQSVIAGQELALVGSDQDLVAFVRVSQSKADQLRIGQKAIINTRQEKCNGVVSRITPEVRDGTVEVEVAFSEGVPASARPELSIEAKITAATVQNTLYLDRPVNVKSNTQSTLFQLEQDSGVANLKNITFGVESDRFIQVLEGAKENDRFILSDMSQYRDVSIIELIN